MFLLVPLTLLFPSRTVKNAPAHGGGARVLGEVAKIAKARYVWAAADLWLFFIWLRASVPHFFISNRMTCIWTHRGRLHFNL